MYICSNKISDFFYLIELDYVNTCEVNLNNFMPHCTMYMYVQPQHIMELSLTKLLYGITSGEAMCIFSRVCFAGMLYRPIVNTEH